jgi:hypothetical protein
LQVALSDPRLKLLSKLLQDNKKGPYGPFLLSYF